MPNLSIKNAPDAVIERLRRRAQRHHRSLQGELLAIVEAAARDDRPEPGEPSVIAAGETGARLVAALRASPHRQADLEPRREPMPVRDVGL
ncbi:MAG TPA: Arc family DNA-binding protein [Caulobacteraceae bacterium]|nr:Arc family DNA-binding protein [Caulobacteraceae bacterium]